VILHQPDTQPAEIAAASDIRDSFRRDMLDLSPDDEHGNCIAQELCRRR
jgi:hypothetical protein